MRLEKGLLAGLTTGASNSEGERAEPAQGAQGEAVLPPHSQSSSDCQSVHSRVHPLTLSKQFRSLREETAGTGQQCFGIHRPGERGRALCKCSP